MVTCMALLFLEFQIQIRMCERSTCVCSQLTLKKQKQPKNCCVFSMKAFEHFPLLNGFCKVHYIVGFLVVCFLLLLFLRQDLST